jgi:hypothetical protein
MERPTWRTLAAPSRPTKDFNASETRPIRRGGVGGSHGRIRSLPRRGERASRGKADAELPPARTVDVHMMGAIARSILSKPGYSRLSLTKNNGDPRSAPKVAVLVCFMGYGAGCTSNEPTSHCFGSGPAGRG